MITATDSDNKSSSIALAIDVRNSVPILTVTPPSGFTAVGEQFFLTARAYDPEDKYLPCSRISWSVDPAHSITVGTDPLSCRAVVYFAQEGNHQVRVTATDSLGATFGHTVQVQVGPAPANRAPVIDLDSFKVYSFRGPRGPNCPLGLICPVPDDGVSLLHNGQTGDYVPPLYMEMTVSDPEGDPFNIEWVCQTGDQFAPIVYTEDGTPSCEPLYSPTEPIYVYANIRTPGGIGSDGSLILNTSPKYQFVMLQLVR